MRLSKSDAAVLAKAAHTQKIDLDNLIEVLEGVSYDLADVRSAAAPAGSLNLMGVRDCSRDHGLLPESVTNGGKPASTQQEACDEAPGGRRAQDASRRHGTTRTGSPEARHKRARQKTMRLAVWFEDASVGKFDTTALTNVGHAEETIRTYVLVSPPAVQSGLALDMSNFERNQTAYSSEPTARQHVSMFLMKLRDTSSLCVLYASKTTWVSLP
jgi:hypothetical protein